MIRRQHCTEIQGFLLASPMPAREVGAYLRNFVLPHDLGVAGLADAEGAVSPRCRSAFILVGDGDL